MGWGGGNVGCCGLQLYNFGETVSIPFWTDTWSPDSFYEKIAANINAREADGYTSSLVVVA